MTMESSDHAALEARIRELEAENARLSVRRDGEPAPRSGRGRIRSLASAVCIIIAAVLVPVSIVSAWTRVQLVDEDAFVSTLAPLSTDPAVQALIVDETMEAITDQVDFDALTAEVFSAVTDLGLPPRAASALELLQQPAAAGLESLVQTTVTRVVASDAFTDVWATTTRAAHRALTAAATSDGGGLVVRTDDGVGIQLGAVVERVKGNLQDRGIGVATLIPAVDRVIILGDGQNLALLRTGYAAAAVGGWWLPVVTLALFGLGILLARRRSVAVLGTGVALALGAGSLAAGFAVGGAGVGAVAQDAGLSPSALEVIYAQMVGAMKHSAAVLALLGVLVAVAGWMLGRSRPARALRAAGGRAGASARARVAVWGVDTGRFGRWLGTRRVLVRVLLAAGAVLWLFALRPLSIGDIVAVILTTLAVALILEVLQIRQAEVETAR
ncbi:hypothetical protein [Microbacterium aurantiacum]|uniref:hypothetical protein n=1 Tax=Microbacterium aurantiacum TaxID=162393 RepID=UPI003D704AB8